MSVPAYAAEVAWLGRTLAIDVLATPGDFILLGMQLLEGTRLELEPSEGFLRIIRA